jgi:hypothetical protein
VVEHELERGTEDYLIAKGIAFLVMSGKVANWEPGVYHDVLSDEWYERMCMVEQIIAEGLGLVGEGDI